MLIVQVCDFGTDGDARYRAHDPSRALGGLPGVTSIDCHFLSRHLPELARRADVLLIHFVNDWDFLELCLRRKSAGRITVFEANDYYPDIQPWNPHARNWADGTLAELLRQYLRMADGVQTSTDELAKRWRQLGAGEVAVFPNHLTEVPQLTAMPERPLTIGWGGSAGHLADWYDVAPTLQQWLDANPQVRLSVMSVESARSFFRLPTERYSFKPSGTLEQYQEFLRGIDIGLAPLLPTEFNRCRSDVKFLEYASQGVAGIYADLEAYRGKVAPGETGLLYTGHKQLIDQIERLRADNELRAKLRGNGHNYVRRHRLLSEHIGERYSWYASLLSHGGSTGVTSVDAGPDALAGRGYLELRPEGPEQMLRVALHAPTPAEAMSRLDGLVAAHPGYHAALQRHGMMLNNVREHRPALSSLERARELDPHSARTSSEIGRAWFHLDDHRMAQDAMERAIGENPYHLPAWQYLLRMAAATGNPKGPEWSGRVIEIFPDCLSIGLLAAAALPPHRLVGELISLLNRFVPKLRDYQRQAGLGDFRRAIQAAVKVVPFGPDVISLLARACELFPESQRLSDEYGSALLRAGRVDKGFAQHAQALTLHRQGVIDRDEGFGEQGPPITWQLAEHIRSVGGNQLKEC